MISKLLPFACIYLSVLNVPHYYYSTRIHCLCASINCNNNGILFHPLTPTSGPPKVQRTLFRKFGDLWQRVKEMLFVVTFLHWNGEMVFGCNGQHSHTVYEKAPMCSSSLCFLVFIYFLPMKWRGWCVTRVVAGLWVLIFFACKVSFSHLKKLVDIQYQQLFNYLSWSFFFFKNEFQLCYHFCLGPSSCSFGPFTKKCGCSQRCIASTTYSIWCFVLTAVEGRHSSISTRKSS